jgi:hypothetical protein
MSGPCGFASMDPAKRRSREGDRARVVARGSATSQTTEREGGAPGTLAPPS